MVTRDPNKNEPVTTTRPTKDVIEDVTGVSTEPKSGTTTYGKEGTTSTEMKGKAQDIKEQAKHTKEDFMSRAQQQVRSVFSDQKGRMAQELENVAQVLRKTSANFRERNETTFAHYADSAADQFDNISHYVREKDMGQVIEGIERTARRQPGVFLGGAFAMGLLLARFLKSSGQHTRPSESYFAGTERRPLMGEEIGTGERVTYGDVAETSPLERT